MCLNSFMKIYNNSIKIILVIFASSIIFFAVLKPLRSMFLNPSEQSVLQESLNVIIYTKKGCVYCDMAKTLLIEKKINHEIIDLSFNHDLQKKLVTQTGQTTVPYIFVNNKFIGGYTNLLELEKAKKLQNKESVAR